MQKHCLSVAKATQELEMVAKQPNLLDSFPLWLQAAVFKALLFSPAPQRW